MEATFFSERLLPIYQITRLHIPENCSHNTHRLGNLKSQQTWTLRAVLHVLGHTRWQYCCALDFQAWMKIHNLPIPPFGPLRVFSSTLSHIEASDKGARHATLTSLNRPQNKLTARNGAGELWPSEFQSCTIQPASRGVSRMNLVVILVLWYWFLRWRGTIEGDGGSKIICGLIQNVASFI
jgi:hypothetical protein